MKFFSLFMLVFIFVFLFPVFPPMATAAAPEPERTVTVTVRAGFPEFVKTKDGVEVRLEGFGRIPVPGLPALPARIVAVALPPGARVTGVTWSASREIELPGTYAVAPNPLPLPPGGGKGDAFEAMRREYEANLDAVYGEDRFFPSNAEEFVGEAGLRRYDLADVRVMPVAWNPVTGRLLLRPGIAVTVHCLPAEGEPARPVEAPSSERFEAAARRVIANYEEAGAWYPSRAAGNGRGLHDFVIVTTDMLAGAVQPLADWETLKGRTVEVVTCAWIDANYQGYDLAERIRNFLRDKYPSGAWGIEDVLIAGDRGDVPMRLCEQNAGYGKPETDYYYAELSLPDSRSWDADGDHKWGEDSDPIDFYNEVNVGRIPFSDEAVVDHICRKSEAFERNDDPSFKKNILLLGAFLMTGTDSATLMEAIADPAANPWMAGWTATRMYEKNADYYSSYPCDFELLHDNVTAVWPAGRFAFVDWSGHGSWYASYILGIGSPCFIHVSDCPLLDDDHPAIVCANSCSNADTNYDNIGREMLKQGAVGFLGANKVSFFFPGWDDPWDGSGQSFDYYFSTMTTSGGYSQGGAHQAALRTMYTYGLWNSRVYYQAFEWGTLFGNPDLSMAPVPALAFDFPGGLPGEYEPPGAAIVVRTVIGDRLEKYVPGTGFFNYRCDPSSGYVQAALTPLGQGLFEAVLPAPEAGDEPEFYFSARGDGGTTVFSPEGAPGEVYSFDVAAVWPAFLDDFEGDRGWSVENTGVAAGAWERCDPNGTLNPAGIRVAPEDDNPAGQGTMCFVTENGPPGGVYYLYDVDGGPTRLVSPEIGLTGGDAAIGFFAWYYNDRFDDPFDVDVSCDGGATWTRVATLERSAWDRSRFVLSDFLAPGPSLKVRFSAVDDPDNSVTEAGLDDFVVEHIDRSPGFYADSYRFSAAAGCSIDLFLDAGPSFGGRHYRILGSLSGSWPGTPLPGGKVLPLNWDGFTTFLFACPGAPAFQDFRGDLDGRGRAKARIAIAGPGAAPFAGRTVTMAYALKGSFDYVSNPIFIVVDP